VFYRAVRRLFLLLAGPLFGLRVLGASRVPECGPAILIAAHRSWLDPACVAAACRRPVRFLIRASVYHTPWARWFYRAMGSIPVAAPVAGSSVALRRALRHLKRGEVVGVFPEGGIVPDGQSARILPGAALLAVRTGAPVVPLRISGSARAWPHGKRWPRPAAVQVSVGVPIPVPPGGRRALHELQRQIEIELRRPAAP
jgi:1-acyl-sn-glycerol-3-phosphate acyltransferase